jgi:hypothetical protein
MNGTVQPSSLLDLGGSLWRVNLFLAELFYSSLLLMAIVLGFIYLFAMKETDPDDRILVKVGIILAFLILLMMVMWMADYLLHNSPVFQ